MTIENALETSYISIDYAMLRVLVKDVKKFEQVFELHKNVNLYYKGGDTFVDMIPDEAKREKYSIPDFVEQIRIHADPSFDNCLLVIVLDGFDIKEVHDWIQYFERTF